MYKARVSSKVDAITSKINELNNLGIAAMFVVTGANGTGKTHLAKRLLTELPFHQSFNLGLITKTIRFLTDSKDVTVLENFRNERVDVLFTHIIKYSCSEYQRNGVNVLIDGVQIDTVALNDDSNILGGIILDVNDQEKLLRNDKPTTHFKRKLAIHSATDVRRYIENDTFKIIRNDGDFQETYYLALEWIEYLVDKKLSQMKGSQNE